MKSNFTLSILLVILTSTLVSAQCSFQNDNSGASCDAATFLCGIMLHEHEETLPNVVNVNGPSPLCSNGGEANNIRWYRFLVCDEYVELLITPSNCTTINNNGNQFSGIQAGIYNDCSYSQELACSSDGNTSPFTLSGNNFTPGKLVYMFLDGDQGSVCDYKIEIVAGIDTSTIDFESDSLDVPDDGMVMGLDTVCSNSIVDYSFSAPTCVGMGSLTGCLYDSLYEQNLICYEWLIEPDSGYVFIGDSTASEITLEWQVPGDYTIDVNVHLDPVIQACSSGIFECGELLPLPVVVLPPTYNYLPIVYLCRGDSYTYCGETYFSDVTAYCEIDSCLFEVQEIIFQDPTYNFIGTQFVCASSDCFFYNGVEYCDPGFYSIQNINAQCEEYDEFEIVDLQDVPLNTIATNDINCIESSSLLSAHLDLQGFFGNVDIAWIDGNGNTVGNSLDLNVNTGGTYTCMISFPEYNLLCSKESTVYIDENTEEVIATLNYVDIDCANPETVVEYNANQEIINHRWEGPNGFYSTSSNPSLTEEGFYQVILTAENGCEFTDGFMVEKNVELPISEFITHEYWGCQTEFMTLQLEDTDPEWLVTWETVNGEILIEESSQIQISQTGIYTATILDPDTQCEYVISTLVENDPEMLVDFDLESSDIYCYGADDGILSIENVIGGVGPYKTTINGQGISDLYQENLPPGTYEVVLADANGCELIKIIEISELPEIIIDIESEIQALYETDEAISLSIEASADIDAVVWTDVQDQNLLGTGLEIMINITEDTEIKVTVTDIYDCQKEKEVLVKIRLADEVYIPNIFSPNADGFNDYFTAFSIHSPGKIQELNVYDRWGTLVFTGDETSLNNEEKGWDGSFNGRPLPAGAYVYQATINNGGGKMESRHGSVTLVR